MDTGQITPQQESSALCSPIDLWAFSQYTNQRSFFASAATDPEMIPPVAIGLFAGLRRSEFFALDWSEVDLENRTIEVKGIKAKTRQGRLVHITENLFE